MLDIQTKQAGTYTIFRPIGDLDALSATQFRHSLVAMASAPHLIIDLAGVPFVDSSGLGALIGGIRGVRESGGEAAVVCSRPSLNRVLHTAGLDRLVILAPSVEEAALALRGVVAVPNDTR